MSDTKKKKATKKLKKAANGGDSNPMEGKKLLQTWVDDNIAEEFEALAEEHHLRPATYLRQVVHGHLDAHRGAAREGAKAEG